MRPIGVTVSPASCSTAATCRGLARRDHGDHADAAVEGAHHLLGRARRRSRPARKTPAARRSRERSSSAAIILGQHARDVVGKAAAGDVRQRLDAVRAADRLEDRPSHRCASARAAPRPACGRRRTARASVQASPDCATMRRTSEKPLEWTPEEASPSSTSPSTTSSVGSSWPRSAAPTAKPARS